MSDPRRLHPGEWPGKSVLGSTLMLVREELRASRGGAELKTPLLNAFARRLAYAAREMGERGIIAAIAEEEMRSLGLEMDCGRSFRIVCGLELGDLRGLEPCLDRIDDPLVLGSAIFSEWRYFTHWATEPMGDEHVRWFELTARRLEEITTGDDACE